MNLKNHSLGTLPMDAGRVQEIYGIASRMTKEGLADAALKMIRDLSLSHERLRAERDGLQAMFDEQERDRDMEKYR